MFTMAKIKDGSSYLERHLVANDYYSEKETIVGHWLGEAAPRLSLSGEIQAGNKAFAALRDNRHPETGAKLTPRDCEKRTRFYDFQCSAQKSVSIMAVTFGDTRLLAAHDKASAFAYRELERFAARHQNTALTRHRPRTGNVVAAAFRHTASRALDPQVHTHFVTANATWDPNTKSWRALAEFEMVSAIRYAGKVYQNEMAAACRRLGYPIVEVRNDKGVITGFEIAGISPAIRDRFSKRRAEVERGIAEFKTAHGREPSASETHAITVDTRNPKLAEITTPEVLAAQRAQLSARDLSRLERLKSRAERREADLLIDPRLERESLRTSIHHLYERRSVCKGHEVLAEALNTQLGHVRLAELKSLGLETGLIGLSRVDWLHDDLATTTSLYGEHWAATFVESTQGKYPPLGGSNPRLADKLSPDQREAALKVLGSRDQVISFRGAAGVGKSTVLSDLVAAAKSSGHDVHICAPTSSAVDTLRSDGITRATTLTAFFNDRTRERSNSARPTLYVVDESGLASNAQGVHLLRLAERSHARVLFVGDHRQHTSVEAGDFLRVLETHSAIHKVELGQIRRQEHAAYREAIASFSVGASQTGLEQLQALGWVKEGRSEYLKNAAIDYADRVATSKSVLAVTPTWGEHAAFTTEVRSQLRATGRLGPDHAIVVLDPLKLTQAQLAQVRSYVPGLIATFNKSYGPFQAGEAYQVVSAGRRGVFVETPGGPSRLPLRSKAFSVSRSHELPVATGDRILIRANLPSAKLINGEIVTVAEIADGRLHFADGRILDTRYRPPIAHGFAVTSHASQSKTVDHVIVAAERLDAKAAYVACSRGRYSCTVHTPDTQNLLSHLPQGNRTAVQDLISRKELARLATVQDRQALWERAKAYFNGARKKAAEVVRVRVERWTDRLKHYAAEKPAPHHGYER